MSPLKTLLFFPSDEINLSTADDLLPSETLVSPSLSGGGASTNVSQIGSPRLNNLRQCAFERESLPSTEF